MLHNCYGSRNNQDTSSTIYCILLKAEHVVRSVEGDCLVFTDVMQHIKSECVRFLCFCQHMTVTFYNCGQCYTLTEHYS